MKNVKLLFFLAIMSIGYGTIAQQTSIPNVLKIRSIKSKGAIVENNKLVGYYLFFFKEKNDRKTSTYELVMYDDNYNQTSSFELTRPKNSYLMETVYNGNVFMLFFYNQKTGYEFLTVDRTGKEHGKIMIPKADIPSYDLQATRLSVANAEDNITIYPFGDNGFIRQTYVKNKKVGYEIVAYDNEMNKLWSKGSNMNSKQIQTAEISEISEKLITATIYSKKNIMTRKMDLSFLILNGETGEVIKEVPMGNADEGKQTVLRTYFDEEQEKIFLIGETFKPGDDFLKDKSQGIFVRELNEDGSDVRMNEYRWKGEIDQFKQNNLSEEDKKETKGSFSLMFHNVIRSSTNGHLYLIAEQFRKQVSAGAVALKVVAGATGGQSNASNFEIRISNMILIELDDMNKMIDYKVIKKKRTSEFLPQGAGIWGTAYLGYYIKSTGGFDYAFTSSDKEKDRFTIIYRDANRKEEKGSRKSDVMIGIIDINKGKVSTERVPLNTEAKRFWLTKAKPGYISISEYFKKEKRYDMRLEKISY